MEVKSVVYHYISYPKQSWVSIHTYIYIYIYTYREREHALKTT